MNDLLIVSNDSDFPIDGRNLHSRLMIKTVYSRWFERMCEYGFTENTDFLTVAKNVNRANGTIMPQIQHDHKLSISMAKEICMIQRTEQGKKIRKYLIDLETQWNAPEKVMERAQRMVAKMAHDLEELTTKYNLLHESFEDVRRANMSHCLERRNLENRIDRAYKVIEPYSKQYSVLCEVINALKPLSFEQQILYNPDGSTRQRVGALLLGEPEDLETIK